MLGWEYPPHISGGLGTACHGLTRGLAARGARITFVLPRAVASSPSPGVRLTGLAWPPGAGSAEGQVSVRPVPVSLSPYARPEAAAVAGGCTTQPVAAGAPGETQAGLGGERPTAGVVGRGGALPDNYRGDLLAEVRRYARLACDIGAEGPFDIVHAHDWMTWPAAAAAAEQFAKPFIAHVHSTEFDRSGEHVNQQVYDIERTGLHRAARVVTVSRYTRDLVVERYGVPKAKITVVHNAVEPPAPGEPPGPAAPARPDPIVLFLGRITWQKGPEYFLAAAKRVLEKIEDVTFVMAGSGDRMVETIARAAGLGIGHRVLFTGFLRGDEVTRAFRMATLMVMPSVSEPFGIAALEAMAHGVPVLVSRTSGAAEALGHVLKVDFWDIEQMADKIVAVLRRAPLRGLLRENGRTEAGRFRWDRAALQCLDVYAKVCPAGRPAA
jgi:glycosyltransferase involved in cell wall biosynthesis